MNDIVQAISEKVIDSVPSFERLLTHITHPGTDPVRVNENGFGIYFIQSSNGKVYRVHDTYGPGNDPVTFVHDTVEDAIEYCDRVLTELNYYTYQNYDERFRVVKHPTSEQANTERSLLLKRVENLHKNQTNKSITKIDWNYERGIF